jgi:phosphopantetheinyl transferase
MRPMKREAILLVNSRRLHDTGRFVTSASKQDCIDAARYFRPLRRRQFLAGRGLVRLALEKATGIAGEAWRIEADPNGRPHAIGPDERPGPDISVSHSGEYVATGLTTQGRIGIDIELTRIDRPIGAFASLTLSLAEQAAVDAGGQGAWLRFWTLREAIGKADGRGMPAALAADGGVLLPIADTAMAVKLAGEPWILGQRSFGQGSLAVAWRIDNESPKDAVAQLSNAISDDRLVSEMT